MILFLFLFDLSRNYAYAIHFTLYVDVTLLNKNNYKRSIMKISRYSRKMLQSSWSALIPLIARLLHTTELDTWKFDSNVNSEMRIFFRNVFFAYSYVHNLVNKHCVFAITFDVKFLRRSFLRCFEGKVYFIEYSQNQNALDRVIILNGLSKN